MGDLWSLCYLASLIVGIVLGVWGFMDMLKKQSAGESNTDVIQRQIRGIGFLLLAQVAVTIGMLLCSTARFGFSAHRLGSLFD